MKLRIRYGATNQVLVIDASVNDTTLEELTNTVKNQLVIEGDFKLSLNGKDFLEGHTKKLSEFGIVPGDLVKVTGEHAPSNGPGKQMKERDVCKGLQEELHRDGRNSNSCETCKSVGTSGASRDTPLASSSSIRMEVENEAVDGDVRQYLREPLLVRDATTAALPGRLVETHQAARVTSQHEAVAVVMHVLMFESGFDSVASASQAVTVMPEGWRAPGLYRMVYSHTECPQLQFKLTCVPLGGNLVVHGVCDATAVEGCQINVKSADYAGDTFAAPSYKNLSKLSRIFKDAIPYPLLQYGREKLGLPKIHGFLGMMPEIQLMVLAFLGTRDLGRLSQTCKACNTLTCEPVLWRRLYIEEFGKKVNMDFGQDWYKLYKENFLLRKEMRAHPMGHPYVNWPPYLDRPHPPLPTVPVYPPGVIGGDYDLDPNFPGLPRLHGPQPLVPRPRFDPIGPLPDHRFRPGRGGGLFDSSSSRLSLGGFFGSNIF